MDCFTIDLKVQITNNLKNLKMLIKQINQITDNYS